nr:HIPL1 protein [Tanacetum cinerariifolium]
PPFTKFKLINDSPEAEDDLNLWGNYSIPRDNPHAEDKELLPEIWALGFRNPWRWSFDAERPSYFLCADVGQDCYEEIDVITKGGNYGWSTFEGHLPVDSLQPTKGNTSDSIDLIFPAMGYNHYDVNKKEGSAAISGGYFYRSTTEYRSMHLLKLQQIAGTLQPLQSPLAVLVILH